MSIRLNNIVVDMSDSDASDPSHCVLDARVNAALFILATKHGDSMEINTR